MSFFDELKRRNVFKVGIAYAVTSWLLIQVTDILFESIGTPPWVMQAMFVVLAAGFIIALILAWAFEMTPSGVKKVFRLLYLIAQIQLMVMILKEIY